MPAIKTGNQVKVEMFDGVMRTTLACGKDVLMARFDYKKGSHVPPHKHAYEQVTTILKGKQRVIIRSEDQDEDFIVVTGESYVVPADCEHEQFTLEETITFDAWSLAL
ncbi:MAG: cupin domain-containing protein [Acidobacteriota bacterium]